MVYVFDWLAIGITGLGLDRFQSQKVKNGGENWTFGIESKLKMAGEVKHLQSNKKVQHLRSNKKSIN